VESHQPGNRPIEIVIGQQTPTYHYSRLSVSQSPVSGSDSANRSLSPVCDEQDVRG